MKTDPWNDEVDLQTCYMTNSGRTMEMKVIFNVDLKIELPENAFHTLQLQLCYVWHTTHYRCIDQVSLLTHILLYKCIYICNLSCYWTSKEQPQFFKTTIVEKQNEKQTTDTHSNVAWIFSLFNLHFITQNQRIYLLHLTFQFLSIVTRQILTNWTDDRSNKINSILNTFFPGNYNSDVTKDKTLTRIIPKFGVPQMAVFETSQKGYHLNRLSQSHLVTHDSPCPLLVQFPHPSDTGHLVSVGEKLEDH